jgi:di/tricarboxylate transporter
VTPEIATVLAILAVAVLLFVTERIRVDLVALLVLVSLAVTGLVTPTEALSGFSNLAVVTVWAVLILSAGLGRTGLASLVSDPLLRLAGASEIRLVALIMLTAGVLSGFMNDIAVAALLLPVVVDIARRTDRLPSKLLIPLAYASLLGGLNTLIGTPPNILISEALRGYGLAVFRMFDYTPTGIVVMLAGIAYMALVGHRLLPARDFKAVAAEPQDALGERFGLREQLFVVRLPDDSALAGKTLADSHLGAALGLNVVAIIRGRSLELAPGSQTLLQVGDRLLLEGRLERVATAGGRTLLTVEEEQLNLEGLASSRVGFAEVGLSPGGPLVGQTLEAIGFRRRYGINVLAIRRGSVVLRADLDQVELQQTDLLLVQGRHGQLAALQQDPDLLVSRPNSIRVYHLEDRLMAVRVPQDSLLAGSTLGESRLGEVFGLDVLGIVRDGVTHLAPDPEEPLLGGDMLLVNGQREDLATLQAFRSLVFEGAPSLDLQELESEKVGLIEAVLAPRSALAGMTLRQVHFREKYGLSVLAIWREGRIYRTDLRDMTLRFGDDLLLYGPRDRLQVLSREPDFLVLTERSPEVPRRAKAPLALGIMAVVLIPVTLGWLPIAISALLGVVLMILTGCLTMSEAYRAIEWQAIFLIAGMLPLGIAMERTGTAMFLAEQVVRFAGGWGPLAVMAGLFLLTALASQVMPNTAVAVLLAPIALNTANDLGVSPYPLMMAIAVSASAAFLSPVACSTNVLVMGPGGYRFADYTRAGLPLTLIVLLVTLLVVPVFWPF